MVEVAAMDDQDRFRRMSDDEREQTGSSPAGESAKDDDWDLIVPIPDTVPAPNMRHWILGDPVAVWVYRDRNGDRVCSIGRYNKADGEKEFRPRTWCRNRETGREEWRWRHVPPLRPLYGVELLAQRPDAAVIVTEGEKACEAAGSVFTADVVVSPMNGAKSPHKADWEPLRGRHVIIWPDRDKVGEGFAVAIAGLLKDVAASVNLRDARDARGHKASGS
jgi:putative DNA primase/helicase